MCLDLLRLSQSNSNRHLENIVDDISHQINRNIRSYHTNTTIALESAINARHNSDPIITYTVLPTQSSTTIHTELTAEEIAQETSESVYTVTDASSNYSVCPISLEPFVVGEMITTIHHCGHKFKSAHLSNWFRRSTSCPSCRYNLQRRTTTTASRTQPPPVDQSMENALSSFLRSLR